MKRKPFETADEDGVKKKRGKERDHTDKSVLRRAMRGAYSHKKIQA